MRHKTLLLLTLMVLFSASALGYISDNFTQIEDPTITNYVFAFKNSFGSVEIFFWVIASLGVVASGAIFFWSNDWVNSALFGSFISLFAGFLAVLIVKDGVRLITWDAFSLFVSVTALLTIYKKVSDR